MSTSTTQLKLVYLADDDADDRLLFAEAVKDLGIGATLVSAHDGKQLMQRLDADVPPEPTLIFLDLNMPLKNGFECLTEIKQTEKLKDIPVVIFSTSCQADAIDELYEKGADYYICKPDNFQKLKSVLQKVFEIKFDDNYARPHRERFLIDA